MKKEFFAPTVEEAVQAAAERLGLPEEKIEYEVVGQEFKKAPGKFRRAIVVEIDEEQLRTPSQTVAYMDEQEEQERAAGDARWAAAFCKGIFGRMGISSQTEIITGDEKTVIEIEIEKDALDLRRGRSRELRGAIQHLVNRMMSRNNDGYQCFIVDIGGSLQQRAAKMEKLANYLGERARQTNTAVNIQLMDSQDRRLLHEALVECEGITTQGRGEKQFRILSVLASGKK